MARLKQWISLLRLPNLAIVLLTEYLLFFCLLEPVYRKIGIPPALDPLEFFLLVLATLIVTLGGYLINDIEDVKIDQINKPSRIWIGELMSDKNARFFYYGVNVFGLILSVFVAVRIGNWKLSLLYPLAAGLLWSYSRIFKKQLLAGNFIVSLFCGLVALLVLFAEREAFAVVYDKNEFLGNTVWMLFWGFALFGFLSTFIREIIKDIEDLEGDAQLGLGTLPIIWGERIAIKFAQVIAGILLFLLALFLFWNISTLEWRLGSVYVLICLIFPLVYLIRFMNRMKAKEELSKLSLFLKIYMLLGLLYLVAFRLFFPFINT